MPANLEILTYEVTSFLHQYDVISFSFCIRREYSASMKKKNWPRLNTTRPNPFGKNQAWRLHVHVCVTDIHYFLLTQKASFLSKIFTRKQTIK